MQQPMMGFAPPGPVAAPKQQAMMVPQAGDGALKQAMQVLQSEQQMVRVMQLQRKRDACSCDFNNMYVVMNSQGQPVFFVQENSTCIERNCCSGECKAWRLDVALLGPQGVDGPMTPFAHLERPFTCTICCLNRPQVEVTEVPSGKPIGTLTDPWACCALNTTVDLPGTGPILKANAGICQPGMFCPCPGFTIDFPVMDYLTLQNVANITKVWTMGDICPLCSKEWSTLDVSFGAAQDPNSKMLLMSTALFLQLAWFDKRNQN